MAKKKGNNQEITFYSTIYSIIKPCSFYLFVFIFLLSVFLTLIPLVDAQEEFSATAQSHITTCACTQYLGTLSLSNTGTLTSHYNIITSGDAAVFTAHNPWQTVLQAGEKQEIAYYVNIPCDYSKVYMLATQIETNTGYKKELLQQITPVLCSSLQISYIGNNAYKNCACTPTIYAIKVKNIASYADIFSFSLDLPREYYQASEYSLLLLPQEEKSVYFYVKLPCEYSSAYTFTVSVKTQSTETVQELPLYLQIDKTCYQPVIELGKSVSVKDNSFAICANTTTLLPVKIKNPTTIPNKFTIDLENKQSWMVVDNQNNYKYSFLSKYSFWLYEQQEQLVDLFFSPSLSAIGVYQSNIITSLQYGKMTYKTPFTLTVADCKHEKNQTQIIDTKTLEPVMQQKFQNQTNQTSQQTQQQQKNRKWILSIVLFLFFLLLLLLLILLYFNYLYPKQSSKKEAVAESAEEFPKSKKQVKDEAPVDERVIAVEDEEQSKASESNKSWYQRYLPLFIVLFIVLLLLLLLFFIQTPLLQDQGNNLTKNETKNITLSEQAQQKQVVKNITFVVNKSEIKNLTQKPLTEKELAMLVFTNRTLYMNEPYF